MTFTVFSANNESLVAVRAMVIRTRGTRDLVYVEGQYAWARY